MKRKEWQIYSAALSCLALVPSFSVEPDKSSNTIKSPADVQQELNQAQKDFEIAQKMFIPWYTGPLITGSASNVSAGSFNIQPYIFFNDNHAEYNKNRHSKGIHNKYVLNPLLVVQAGATSWLDFSVQPQGYFSWQNDKFGDGFGDFPLQMGLQIYRETSRIPNIRLVIGEVFPTGKYKNLDPFKGGLDSSGAGVFATTVGLNLSKVFWWLKLHPMRLRWTNQVTLPNHLAEVRGFNAYGGGFGTKGKVHVGQSFSSDVGFEVSLNQKWVLATDIVYSFSKKSSFYGKNGLVAPGVPASTGSPLSDSLSFSPALEYNLNDYSGFIGGLWFTATGRNSYNFLSAVISYTVVF